MAKKATKQARGSKSTPRKTVAPAAPPSPVEPERPLRVLTFNWNETYTALLARVFPNLHVIDRPSLDQTENAWDMRVRGIPAGVRILHDPDMARRNIIEGLYDVVICHTIRDVEFVKPLPVAAVLFAHTALEAEIHGDPERGPSVKAFLTQLLSARGILFAAPSEMKAASWGLGPDVISHAIDVDEYPAWIGDWPSALVVGNDLAKWKHATGYELLKKGLAGVEWMLLGTNVPNEAPGMTMHGLANPSHTREQYQHRRAYVSTLQAPFEDAVNLATLEAMAYGMPIVTLAHPASPFKHNANALVGKKPADLGRLTRKLIDDPALGKKLGAAARELAEERFAFEPFRRRWLDFVQRAISHWGTHRVKVAENSRIAQEHLALGLSYVKTGRLVEAEAAFIIAAQTAPDSPGPFCNLGAFYLNQGRLEEARQYLELSLFTDPYFLPALLNMARVNMLENVPEAAMPLLEAAISIAPDDPTPFALLAMACMSTGDPQRGRDILLDLERRGAPEEMILPLMAQAHRESADFARATEAAQRWVAVDPANPDAHRELSQSLLLQGKFDEAQEALTRALELDALR